MRLSAEAGAQRRSGIVMKIAATWSSPCPPSASRRPLPLTGGERRQRRRLRNDPASGRGRCRGSVAALDAEVDDLVERALLCALGEMGELDAGRLGVFGRAREAVAQRPMALEEAQRGFKIALALLSFLERPAPERTFFVVAAMEGEHDRKRDLTVPEIIADRLAELGLAGRVVEHV